MRKGTTSEKMFSFGAELLPIALLKFINVLEVCHEAEKFRCMQILIGTWSWDMAIDVVHLELNRRLLEVVEMYGEVG